MSILFDADFAAGDFSEFTASVTDGGDLAVAVGAALAGTNYGLSVTIDDTTLIYAYKLLAADVTTGIVRFRFYIDPNTLTMTNSTQHSVILITDTAGTSLISGAFLNKTAGGEYSVYAICGIDSGLQDHVNTTAKVMTDAEHFVEVLTVRATNSTSADGYSRIWVDNGLGSSTVNVDNYDKMDGYQLVIVGAPSGIDASTSGTFYLDEIVLRDDNTEIGPVSGGSTSLASELGSFALNGQAETFKVAMPQGHGSFS